MNEETKNYLTFLNEEFSYLLKIKLFLLEIPGMITRGDINQLEFQSFLEKYEMEMSRFLFEKNRHKENIAQKMRVKADQVTFKLLVHVGNKDFEAMGRKIVKITNEITMHLFKVSVYMQNFAKMQMEFKRLNSFLYQNDYSAAGLGRDNIYNFNSGRNFVGEA